MRATMAALLTLPLSVRFASAAEGQRRFLVEARLPTFVIEYVEDRPPGYSNGMLSVTSSDGVIASDLEPDEAVGEVVPPRDQGTQPWLVTLDVNFDGYKDLLLLADHSEETGGTRRVVWTYAPSRRRFEHQPVLSDAYNLEVDPAARTVRSEFRGAYGSPLFERKSWRWVRGELQLIRTERQVWDDRRRCYSWTLSQRVQGAMRQTEGRCRSTPVAR